MYHRRMRSCALFFDGAIDKNPGGTACYGAFIVDTNKKKHYPVKSVIGVVGTGPAMTVNVAEYNGLLHGIIAAKKLGYNFIDIYGDSQMVINMVSRVWGKTNPHGKYPNLRALLYQIWEELEPVACTLQWIPRSKNERADKLSKAPYTKKYKRRKLVRAAPKPDPKEQEKRRKSFFSR